MKKHQKTIGDNDEWLTPPWIIEALGEFDLDPCDAVGSPYKTAKRSYTRDGLELEWTGRVWMNPPFNRYERPHWMRKMASHNNGIMLIPGACETEPFYESVWPKAAGICFLDHRPHFHYISGERAEANSGCTICLVAYSDSNLESLRTASLGVVIDLKKGIIR